MSEAPDPVAEAPQAAETPAPEAAQAAEAPEAPEVAEATAEAAGDGSAATDATPEPERKPKSPISQLQGRVGHLTKTLHERDSAIAERDRQLEAYKALLNGQRPGAEDPSPGRPLPSQTSQPAPGTSEFDALVLSQAQRLASEQAFNRDCDAIYNAGLAKHGDAFKESAANLNALGYMSPTLVQAAMATGEAADVLNHLGSDVDEAARIAHLPPAQMGVELAKLAGKLTSPKEAKQISRAPAPITPVGGATQASNDVYDANISMEEYVRRRKAQGAKWAK